MGPKRKLTLEEREAAQDAKRAEIAQIRALTLEGTRRELRFTQIAVLPDEEGGISQLLGVERDGTLWRYNWTLDTWAPMTMTAQGTRR